MALTRFKDARAGKDGPVSGAIIYVPIQFSNCVTNTVYAQAWSPPAGMKVEIVDIDVQALGITSDPSLTIGTAKAGAQIVAAVNLTTNLGSLTLVSTEVDSDDVLDVRITNDTGDIVESASVNMTVYVSGPPTSLAQSDRGGAAGY